MLTKEENQLLINEFVEKNVDAITNLGEDKQKAIFDAILLIQNKFGNVTQSLLKDNLIKPIQNEPLPFKVGDKFNIKIRGTGNIYIIDSIESNRVVVKIKLNDGQIYDYDYSIEEVKKAFEDGTWVKIEEELPFKVGDRFINTTGSRTIIHTILEIDPIKNYFEFEGAGMKVNGWTLDEAKKEFEKGEWVLENTSQAQTPTFKFNIGDTFEIVSNKSTWTIVDIVKDFDEYIIKNDDNQTTTPIKRQLFEEDIEFKRIVQVFVNQTFTIPTTTSTTSKASTRKNKTISNIPQITIVNKDEEIETLEEAIETQKLLLSFADTKDEKEEIKNLLKDLRSQLKNLKK